MLVHVSERLNNAEQITLNTLGESKCALHPRAHVMHGSILRIECAKPNLYCHFIVVAGNAGHDMLHCVDTSMGARCGDVKCKPAMSGRLELRTSNPVGWFTANIPFRTQRRHNCSTPHPFVASVKGKAPHRPTGTENQLLIFLKPNQ